jgi:hypothetical protein
VQDKAEGLRVVRPRKDLTTDATDALRAHGFSVHSAAYEIALTSVSPHNGDPWHPWFKTLP